MWYTMDMKSRRNRSVFHRLEKVCRGAGNHRRIEILYLLKRKPNLSVYDIAEELGCNFKTISSHTLRLVQSGLIDKWSDGISIRHGLTPLGETILKFLRTLE